jgi:hypothetical protein
MVGAETSPASGESLPAYTYADIVGPSYSSTSGSFERGVESIVWV